jgi:hypothetical protein
MALEIPHESNDALLVSVLGITTITVHYDDLEFSKNEYSTLVLKPTSAAVTLSDVKYDVMEPSDDLQLAIRTWVAAKVGVDANDVQIA